MSSHRRPYEWTIESESRYPELTPCWVCVSHKPDAVGYIHITLTGGHGVKLQNKLHRYIYEECFGPIPENMVIRHRCDNKPCINPEHLLVGTVADNVADRVARRRGCYGAKNPKSVLTDAKVRKIRLMLLKKNPHQIARRFNVSWTTIANIKNGMTWGHLV